MKKLLISLSLSASLVAGMSLISGCLTTPPPQAVVTLQPVTNQVPIVATNSAGVVATNLASVVTVQPVTNLVAQPVQVNSNGIQQIVSGAQTVGAIVTPINPAIGMSITTIAGLVGTLLFGVSTGVAAYKNQSQKNILQAVIAGVEGAPPAGGNDATPITTAAVKQSIATAATNAGVIAPLNALVKATT